MKQLLQYVITFGVPVVVLVLMLAPFFILRKARGWLGDWRGAFLRWGVGIIIGVVSIDLLGRVPRNIEGKILMATIFSFFAMLIFTLIWPFFGFNLAQGNKLTKSIVFQLIIGLINVAIGIFLIIMAIPWGLAGLGGL